MSATITNVNRLTDAMTRLFTKMDEACVCCLETATDISKQELSLIGYIGVQGEVIMREIAGCLESPLSTATWVVDKLVTKKYLKRYNSITDRRIVKVGLTGKGQKTFELFQKKKMITGEAILSGLDEKEQLKLIKLLEKATDNLTFETLREKSKT